MNLKGHRNDAGESRPVSLPLECLDSIGVWLSCQAIIWISGIIPRFCESGHKLCSGIEYLQPVSTFGSQVADKIK